MPSRAISFFALCLILSQLLIFFGGATAVARAKKVASPVSQDFTTDDGEALVARVSVSNASVKQLGTSIHKEGGNCENGQKVKAAGEKTMDGLLDDMGMKPSNPEAERAPASDQTKKEYPTAEYEGVKGSVLTEQQARDLQKEMAGLGSHMRFNIPESGCAPRAELMAMAMVKKGIAPGKIWIEPGLFGSVEPRIEGSTERFKPWDFHVAPYVLVMKDGKPQPWIIDPSIDRKNPIPLDQYKPKMSSRPNHINIDFTGPYGYSRSERFTKRAGFKTNDSMRASDELGCVGKDIRKGTRGCASAD